MSVTQMKGAEDPAESAKGGGKKKLVIVVVLLAVLGGAGYWFFLKPPAAEAAPEPGEVVVLEPIQVNLASDHYLRLGLALQMTAGAHSADGSKALDTAITTFSGLPLAEVNDPKTRKKLKKELVKELDHLYHHEVMDVYFTEFVTQ